MRYYRLMNFNWQQSDWPSLTYIIAEIQPLLSRFSEKSGALRALLSSLDADIVLDRTLVELGNEAVDTSAIEGVHINRDAVMSSVCSRLGRKGSFKHLNDAAADGFAEMMVDVRGNYATNLTKTMLYNWHTLLFKGSRSAISAGKFRTHAESMMVLGGGIEGNDIRFIAPPSKQVGHEMTQFINWFNRSKVETDTGHLHPALRASIAHLYFESIHPFEDGNGRIGRMLICKVIAQHLDLPVLLPVSVAIRAVRKDYYEAIQAASRSNEVTEWCKFFTRILSQSLDAMTEELIFVVKKIQFFRAHTPTLNSRQIKVLQRMADEGPKGFQGGMNATKYQKIALTSKATATRDLAELCHVGALIRIGTGPTIRYHLPFTVYNP